MYSIKVEHEFIASHFVVLSNGQVEDTHSHQWKVWVSIARECLDENGFVMDFHVLQDTLRQITEGLSACECMNSLACFNGKAATAEVIAKYIYDEVLATLTDDCLIVQEVALEEASGCLAIWQP